MSLSPVTVTLAERIAQLVKRHGSMRIVARVIDIDVAYLSRLSSGEKTRPGKTILRRLGLRQIVTYERVGAQNDDAY